MMIHSAPRFDELLDRIDAWLDAHASEFDPFTWTSSDDKVGRRKAFSEAAYYLAVADAVGNVNAVPKLRQQVVERAADPRYASLLLRHPDEFLLYATPFRYLHSIGALTRSAQAAVRDVINMRSMWSVERPPHRILELWNFCQTCGHDSHGVDLEAVLQLSSLRYGLDPIRSRTSDAYALTHVLLFGYDFGIRYPIPESILCYRIVRTIAPLIVRYVGHRNADVALELVMVAALHRELPKYLAVFVWDWIERLYTEHGLVPSPSPPEAVLDQMTVDANGVSTSLEWKRNYHTMLVAGAAARILRRDWSTLDERIANEDAGLKTRVEPRAISRLGEAMAALAGYELSRGAELLNEATSIAGECGPLFASAIEFLSAQRNADGTFGRWVDEEHVFLVAGGNSVQFQREILEPLSQACDGVLQALQAPFGPACIDPQVA